MKVIILKINEPRGPDISFVAKMLRVCSDLGLSPPAYVRTSEALFDILKYYNDQEVVLFANFPSDDTYPGNMVQNGAQLHIDSEKSSEGLTAYSQSAFLFAKVGIIRTFREIHFFTCASPLIISDEFFSFLAPGSSVKVCRIENCLHEKLKYESVYEKYIIDRVKELVYQFQ